MHHAHLRCERCHFQRLRERNKTVTLPANNTQTQHRPDGSSKDGGDGKEAYRLKHETGAGGGGQGIQSLQMFMCPFSANEFVLLMHFPSPKNSLEVLIIRITVSKLDEYFASRVKIPLWKRGKREKKNSFQVKLVGRERGQWGRVGERGVGGGAASWDGGGRVGTRTHAHEHPHPHTRARAHARTRARAHARTHARAFISVYAIGVHVYVK